MILPKWYYCRAGVSDRKWIESRLSFIPERFKQRVSNKYERIYLRNSKKDVREARKLANTYLNKIAKRFHNANYSSN